MARPFCIYHKNCLDGNGAAAIVQRKEPDCEFLSMQYGMVPPTVQDRAVYIVDFALSLEYMQAIKAQASSVLWIDHHASNIPIHRRLGWGILDTNECGSSLTWKTLFPHETPPRIIDYIKDKDLWRWELPDSRAIAAALTVKFPGDKFTGLLDANLQDMAEIGRPLLAATAERVAKAVQNGVAIDAPYGLVGKRALFVACNQDQNEIGSHVCLSQNDGGMGYDLAILVYRKGKGRWVHSLRSADHTGVDCGGLADARGGGGHPQSACYLNHTHFLMSADCPAHLRRSMQ
jgi:uncharacterized protein